MPIERFRSFGVWGGGIFFTIVSLASQFFTLYAQELGASTLAIGFLVTLRAVLPIFIAMPSGQLIDSIGPMRMLLVGNACLLGSLVLNATASSVASLVISQFLLGASIIISASSFQVLVSSGDKTSRNEYIKRYSTWMSGGGMVGPLLGGFVASQFTDQIVGYRAAFGVAAALAALLIVAQIVLSRWFPHPRIADAEVPLEQIFSFEGFVGSYKRGLDLTGHRPVQFGLTATFLIMYIQSLYNSFLPLYMDSVGFSTMIISVALSLHGGAAMSSRFLLGGVMNRIAPEYILTTAGFIAATCVLLTPLAGDHVVTMLAIVMLMGAAVGVNLPVSIMIMVDAVAENERGKLMGLRLLVNRFSQVISPAMFGALGHAFGLTIAMYGGGVFLIATMCGFSAYANHTRKDRKD